MRNLKKIKHSTWRSPPEHQERQISATTWDPLGDSIICAYGPSEFDTLIELVRVKELKAGEHSLITSWDAPNPTGLSCDQIVNLQYFSDSLTACLVLAGGDIIVVREEPLAGEDRIEIVGSVDAGVTAAKWSPDGELLAIFSMADTIVFMSRSFEGILDVTMAAEDLKVSSHVSVGWGKKETQFKGKGAKALRDPTIPERVDEGTLSPDDDGKASISWRGDGAFVAISKIEGGTKRLIRVYSREGVLDSVSEPVDGLEGALTWRPAGNLIAGVQRFSNHIDIVFFERNGLRHGQFSLRLTPEELKTPKMHIKLEWNSDSSVIAVLLPNSVQLWTMGNYHWYLKQEIPIIGMKLARSDYLTWHPEKALLYMIGGADTIVTSEYVFAIARGTTAPPNDFGAIAVIDGKCVKITPFQIANVPPPMALYDINVLGNVIDVAFSPRTSSIAVLYLGGIDFYKWNICANKSPPILAGNYKFQDNMLGKRQYQQIAFGERDDIITLHVENATSSLQHYRFNKEVCEIEEKLWPSGASLALMISPFGEDRLIHPFTQGSSGDLHCLASGDKPLVNYSFPTFLPWVEVVKNLQDFIFFGLSRSGYLYAGPRLLAKNCTSFLVTPAHLIFTTTTHLLKFVHMASIEDLEVPSDDTEKDERCRSIERGARLITVMPTSLSLVLQMPRGNLETIWPRALVLAGIRKLIEKKSYREAFLHCRKQRVDLNILYDHAPEQFMSSIELFIDQVQKVTYIDLFLSSLRDEDVTETMYKETRPPSKLEEITTTKSPHCLDGDLRATNSSKINRICDAVLSVLDTKTSTNLQNIITANVCKSPPALEDGLLIIARLMADNEAMGEKALEHICFLADVNRLYDNALGLYDLDLALLVAQKSQKDPREYLPFLQKLQEMPPTRRKFSIDDYLGRPKKALSHLFELSHEDFSEFEAYTFKHALYKHALSLVRYSPTQLNAIMALYAAYLESNSHFHEAALAYESLHSYDLATACYQRASPSFWRETLFCASQQTPPLAGQALTSLVTSLADSLTEAKDYESAASIHLTYLSMPVTACALLCKGYHFAAAMHLASQQVFAHPELLEVNGTIDTGLTDALSSTTELLAECKAQLLAQVPRIRELHLAAATDPLAFYEGEGASNDIPDNISVTASSNLSTSASLFTRYTGRQSQGTAVTGASRATSKNRRREERKRARGKKGTVYEEEYLVASVNRLVERLESIRDEVRRLVLGLLRRGMRERAAAVEGMMAEVVELCQKAVVDVWGASDRENATVGEGGNKEYTSTGATAVPAESIAAATRELKEAPRIRRFEKLALLGM